MTTFEDGPAKDKHLMLHRCARFLRVVECAGKFDALDQPEDTPAANETLYAYETEGPTGHAHVNMGRGRGGFYPIVSYRFVKDQPSDAEMRTNGAWRAWCERRAKA